MEILLFFVSVVWLILILVRAGIDYTTPPYVPMPQIAKTFMKSVALGFVIVLAVIGVYALINIVGRM